LTNCVENGKCTELSKQPCSTLGNYKKTVGSNENLFDHEGQTIGSGTQSRFNINMYSRDFNVAETFLTTELQLFVKHDSYKNFLGQKLSFFSATFMMRESGAMNLNSTATGKGSLHFLPLEKTNL
jgi:hypothetical protein